MVSRKRTAWLRSRGCTPSTPQPCCRFPLFTTTNQANYAANPADTPVATTADRSSEYAGAQASLTAEIARNTLQAGLYSFGQHDRYQFGAAFHDGSGTAPFAVPDAASGGVVEAYLSDSYRATSWLTLSAGLREAYFQGQFAESETDPRLGLAIQVPRLNWILPRLLWSLLPAATPAHGKRSHRPVRPGEQHRLPTSSRRARRRTPVRPSRFPFAAGCSTPITFQTRIQNFLDHSNIGNSSLYYPVTVDGALVRAWELTLRSPRPWRFGQAHLAYSNQIAEQRGNLTGGLICTPVGDPACDKGFVYTPVDHDQRNTLNVGFNATLPFGVSASTNVYYGSGFHNGNPDPASPYPHPYLPSNTSVDLALGQELRRQHPSHRHHDKRGKSPRSARQQSHLRRLSLQRSATDLRRAALPVQLLISTRGPSDMRPRNRFLASIIPRALAPGTHAEYPARARSSPRRAAIS